ncbi:hypothetical protein X946_5562 [Burkholderia sp. ABCPW 111]|nr:hypothetical protein X946_5562 [Burkholderia sp. ABCPW 111]
MLNDRRDRIGEHRVDRMCRYRRLRSGLSLLFTTQPYLDSQQFPTKLRTISANDC